MCVRVYVYLSVYVYVPLFFYLCSIYICYPFIFYSIVFTAVFYLVLGCTQKNQISALLSVAMAVLC